jgi:hypothetical protein
MALAGSHPMPKPSYARVEQMKLGTLHALQFSVISVLTEVAFVQQLCILHNRKDQRYNTFWGRKGNSMIQILQT